MCFASVRACQLIWPNKKNNKYHRLFLPTARCVGKQAASKGCGELCRKAKALQSVVCLEDGASSKTGRPNAVHKDAQQVPYGSLSSEFAIIKILIL